MTINTERRAVAKVVPAVLLHSQALFVGNSVRHEVWAGVHHVMAWVTLAE